MVSARRTPFRMVEAGMALSARRHLLVEVRMARPHALVEARRMFNTRPPLPMEAMISSVPRTLSR
jgi:hypothetical protein